MTYHSLSILAVAVPVAGVAGLFVGSFLNVVVYRTPLGLSVAAPRSFCPTCRRQLTWWENIPVLAWVGLRGRCRTCHQPIAARYPLVELFTGISFALIAWAWHGSAIAAGYCCLAASMIAVGLIEYDGQRAPLAVAAIGAGVAELVIIVAASWHGHWPITFGSLFGLTLAFLIFLLLRAGDPECADPRGHGRSALLVAGCWVGGLGIEPAIVGAVTWIAAYFICMVGVWSLERPMLRSRGAPRASEITVQPILRTPLVSALALAMVASLITKGSRPYDCAYAHR